MSDDTRQLTTTIDFGMEVEAFLKSRIGEFLIKRAEGEIDQAVEEMKRVDPESSTQIRALQHAIHVAEDIQYWLAEAIQAGYMAQQQFIDSSNP